MSAMEAFSLCPSPAGKCRIVWEVAAAPPEAAVVDGEERWRDGEMERWRRDAAVPWKFAFAPLVRLARSG